MFGILFYSIHFIYSIPFHSMFHSKFLKCCLNPLNYFYDPLMVATSSLNTYDLVHPLSFLTKDLSKAAWK